jgi:glycosyltransferase involved in cell wall biosynthesis
VNECVVNYGTAQPQGNPGEQRDMFLAAFPELRGRRVLLFLGRIHEKKGCDLLIKAFASFAVQHGLKNLHLVIAGPCTNPGYLESLRRLIAELCPPSSVTLPGMLAGDIKWGAFRSAEALILPSHQENFGIALAEALACGLPVLISNKVNIWREIEADGAGLVADDTLAGTRDLLHRWFAMSPEEKEQMSASARGCFDRRFEISMAAASIHGALSSMIGTHSSQPHA